MTMNKELKSISFYVFTVVILMKRSDNSSFARFANNDTTNGH